MRFGTCKDCCKEFPLLEDYRVEKREIWECPKCKCPNSLSDMTITEKGYHYITLNAVTHQIRYINPDGSWRAIAIVFDTEMAEKIVNALNDEATVYMGASTVGKITFAMCASLAIAQEWVIREICKKRNLDKEAWRLPETWFNWKWWQEGDKLKFLGPDNITYGTVQTFKVIEFTNMI